MSTPRSKQGLFSQRSGPGGYGTFSASTSSVTTPSENKVPASAGKTTSSSMFPSAPKKEPPLFRGRMTNPFTSFI
jgi:hypothetical protein